MQPNSAALPISIASLVVSLLVLGFTVYKWFVDWRREQRQTRLTFLRDLFSGFSQHNWRFIDYWDFPGVYPYLEEIRTAIPPSKSDQCKEDFGRRVVALEHLNILLKVFTHRDVLSREDIRGFVNWAQSWYSGCAEALTTILERGDVYPLDFLIWLRDVIFEHNDFDSLVGPTLRGRIDEYKSGRRP
jgi:hypothetical protein